VTSPTWHGAVGVPASSPPVDALANWAKAGDWDRVFALFQSPFLTPNRWRPAGSSFYTPLHQAAWHGAPVDVVERLIELGAWRTLRTARGQRAVDIARQHGHEHLLEPLEPVICQNLNAETIGLLDLQLAGLVESRIRPQLEIEFRHPTCEVLLEIPDGKLWYPVPGMYGGFSIALREEHLYVESWCRVVGGSGEGHVVTRDGAYLVRAGFV
jgi:hypothetical protein